MHALRTRAIVARRVFNAVTAQSGRPCSETVNSHTLTPAYISAAPQILGHHDMLKLILAKVSLPDLCSATSVCRHWRDVARSEDFWSDVDFEARREDAEEDGEQYRDRRPVTAHQVPPFHRPGVLRLWISRNGTIRTGSRS